MIPFARTHHDVFEETQPWYSPPQVRAESCSTTNDDVELVVVRGAGGRQCTTSRSASGSVPSHSAPRSSDYGAAPTRPDRSDRGAVRRRLPITRGATGHCSVYHALGVSTGSADAVLASRHRDDVTGRAATVNARKAIMVEQTVTIDRPASELFAFWRDFENLPRFMDHLVSVRVDSPTTIALGGEGAGRRTVEWDAEIVNEVPNEIIAWKSSRRRGRRERRRGELLRRARWTRHDRARAHGLRAARRPARRDARALHRRGARPADPRGSPEAQAAHGEGGSQIGYAGKLGTSYRIGNGPPRRRALSAVTIPDRRRAWRVDPDTRSASAGRQPSRRSSTRSPIPRPVCQSYLVRGVPATIADAGTSGGPSLPAQSDS